MPQKPVKWSGDGEKPKDQPVVSGGRIRAKKMSGERGSNEEDQADSGNIQQSSLTARSKKMKRKPSADFFQNKQSKHKTPLMSLADVVLRSMVQGREQPENTRQ